MKGMAYLAAPSFSRLRIKATLAVEILLSDPPWTVHSELQKSAIDAGFLQTFLPWKKKHIDWAAGCWTAGWSIPSPKCWLAVAWHFTGYFYILFPVNVVTIPEQVILQAEGCPEELMPFPWTKAGSFIKEYCSEAFKIGVGHVRKRHHKNYWKSIISKV